MKEKKKRTYNNPITTFEIFLNQQNLSKLEEIAAMRGMLPKRCATEIFLNALFEEVHKIQRFGKLKDCPYDE